MPSQKDVDVGCRNRVPAVHSRKRSGNPLCYTFHRSVRQASSEEDSSNINRVLQGIGSATLASYFKEWLKVQIEAQRSHVDLPPNSSSLNGNGLPVSVGGNVLASPMVTLTDPGVLDCPICFDRLSIPVYQCKNGHVSCASCCIIMQNKCGQCSRIGNFRCRAIEKVIESVLSTCRYQQQGCTATFSYSNKLAHEKSCQFGPCTCPHIGCDHDTTFAELYLHFRWYHSECTNDFRFNEPISIPLVKTQTNVYFQEQDGTLFILHRIKLNLFTLLCVGPASSKGFAYRLFARYGRNPEEMTSIEVTSIAANISGRFQILYLPQISLVKGQNI